MRAFLPCRCAPILVLVASVALAQGPDDKIVIRTLMLSEHPSHATNSIYVMGQVVTVLRFDQEVDPKKTKFMEGWEGRFGPLLVGDKKVVIDPRHDLARDERVPLLVTLADGTEVPFLVQPPWDKKEGGWTPFTDHQINVFKDPDSFNAVLSSLYDSLKRERELSEEVQRLKKEENSVDHALATLLISGEVKKTPFVRRRVYRPKNEDMDMVVELFAGPGKAAAVVTLKNTYYGGDWKFDRAYLTHDYTSFTERPFAFRMDHPTIVPGQSGKIAVVVDQSAFKAKSGELEDLALQIFRGDGLLQVAVALEHTLAEE